MLPIRRWAALCVLALIATACGTPHIEAIRIQRGDVKVLPGANGFVNPLTGVVFSTPQPWLDRPVIGIKIGNSVPERPQAGIERADLVYEELTEGGETRFLAFFLTNSPDRVGPVRSCRTVDPSILAPVGGLFGYSGGVAFVVAAVRAVTNVTDVGADTKGDAYYRDPNRSMPYNLYTSATTLWRSRTGRPPVQPQFDFLGTADDIMGGGASGRSASFSFESGDPPVRYTYDAGTRTYLRFNGSNAQTSQSGSQLAFRNVVLQVVNVTAGSYNDRAGNVTHDINLIGTGRAVILRGGKAFDGKWSRSSRNDTTKFTDSAGNALRLAPGRTIVELVPVGQQVSYS
jgi:hypothetical protein